jgi:hypothetical protein
MPQGTPGTSSGTYNAPQLFSNAECVFEAYSRCGIRGTALTQHHMADARRSLTLTLQSWTNKGKNLFTFEQRSIQLVAGQATYLMPPEVVSITDAYYNTVSQIGPGPDYDAPSYDPSRPVVINDPQTVITQSSDRWLRPMGHDYYARIANKTQQGIPVNYWFNRLGPPNATTITFWQVPSTSYPQAAVTYFAIRQIQDANLQNGETPDVVARALDALCAELARRLARKYAPNLIGGPGTGGLLDDAIEAWGLFEGEDTEKAEVKIMPQFSCYFRM